VAIPKNWIIGLTHMFHLDERYFPEPENFNPYRFEVNCTRLSPVQADVQHQTVDSLQIEFLIKKNKNS
jgi:cytochrome P450